jgi:hypothetical protein
MTRFRVIYFPGLEVNMLRSHTMNACLEPVSILTSAPRNGIRL